MKASNKRDEKLKKRIKRLEDKVVKKNRDFDARLKALEQKS